MTALTDYLLVCFGTLFAVLSPLATVPPFLAMTDSDTPLNRLQMARRACIVACLVLVVFSVTGLTILDFFGITVPAFKIAGGILLSARATSWMHYPILVGTIMVIYLIFRPENCRHVLVYRREWRYGAFSRTIPLPMEVQGERAKAQMKDGVIEITIPKSERAKVKEIPVQVP